MKRRKRRAGICEPGNPHHENDRNRSVPPEVLAELDGADYVECVILRKGHPVAASPGLRNADRALWEFGDTAGLNANLVLVIGVDALVVHLAAAMGEPVWVLLPLAPNW